MKNTALFGLLAWTVAATAQGLGPMRQHVIAGAHSTGKTYQFAARCGASAEILAAYQQFLDGQTAEGRAGVYQQSGIDFDRQFAVGKAEGDALYAALKGTARDTACSQTITFVRSQAGLP